MRHISVAAFASLLLVTSAYAQTAESLLMGTHWASFGLGKKLESVTPEQRQEAQNRACSRPTYEFRNKNNSLQRIDYQAGQPVDITYSKVVAGRINGETVIQTYADPDGKVVLNTWKISSDGQLMVEGGMFGPEFFIRCPNDALGSAQGPGKK